MIDPKLMEAVEQINLSHLPVAIAFLNVPPPGLSRVESALPAGCSYWKRASDGHAFYMTADNHQNCPVGAFTHGVTLSPAPAEELQSLVGAMIPQASSASAAVASVACIGNRVYTELADGELYFAVPGHSLSRTLEKLETILTANAELEAFHRQRAATITPRAA